MQKFLLILVFLLCLAQQSFAFENIKYKNLEQNSKILFSNNSWTTKLDKKKDDYFVKQISEGVAQYSDFYSKNGDLIFSTATQYEFIYKGSLIGYSNNDLKFYEFYFDNGLLEQRELTLDEVRDIFPDFKIIRITDFTTTTNCIKVKKKNRSTKLILLNDTNEYFDNYDFASDNAKFDRYHLKGFFKLKKKGLIHFSRRGEFTRQYPWFVILVR